MSLFDSQTIFSLLITLLIGVALYYYIKYKYRVLELTQREQAKILQSVIMSMNSNNQNIMSMFHNKSQEEVISESVNNDINRFNQVNSNNELIDVSDDSEDSSSESSESSDESSDESSESSDSGSECDQDHDHDHDHEVTDNNTRKILFTGNNDSHLVEHLDGPDVKVIELTHPLYPKNNSEDYNNKDDGDYDDEDEDDADDDEDSDSESVPSDIDGHNEPDIEDEKHEIREIKENVVITETNNQNTQNTQNTQNIQIDLETDNISEVISVDNSLDNLSVKTVFKTKDNNNNNKDSETHSDYNSMNVQSLRQLLKNKLSTEGSHMSEASINKLTKKDLIKNLS